MAKQETLSIVRLRATGFQRLTAEGVDVKFGAEGIQFIEGKNSQGKSSTLDALEFAIVGKSALSKNPINDGADGASVEMELSNGKRIVRHVKRKGDKQFTTALELILPGGDKLASSEATVRDWLGEPGISLDPMAFSRMKPKDRRALVAQIAGVNLDLFDAEEKAAEQARLTHYGLYEAAKRKFETKPDLPAKAPALVDVGDLSTKLNAGIEQNEQTRRQRAEAGEALNAAERAERSLKDDEERTKNVIAALEFELNELQQRIAEHNDGLKMVLAQRPGIEKRVEACADAVTKANALPIIDLTEIQTQIANASEVNKEASEYTFKKQQVDEINANWKREEAKRKELSEKVDAVRDARIEALRDAAFPVEGLGFEDEDCTYLGQPFSQASQSEQIKVGLAIAMAQSPNLRLVMSREGSLFDGDNLKAAHEMTAGRGYVFVMEEVRDEPSGRPNSIFIEDGHQKEAENG